MRNILINFLWCCIFSSSIYAAGTVCSDVFSNAAGVTSDKLTANSGAKLYLTEDNSNIINVGTLQGTANICQGGTSACSVQQYASTIQVPSAPSSPTSNTNLSINSGNTVSRSSSIGYRSVTVNGTLNLNGDITLNIMSNSGTQGDLNLNSNGIININGNVTIYANNIALNSQININSGSLTVIASGDVNINSGTVTNTGGSYDKLIILGSNSSKSVNVNTAINAIIYTDGTATINSTGVVYGAVTAKSIMLNGAIYFEKSAIKSAEIPGCSNRSLSISDVSMDEGNSGTSNAVFTVSMDKAFSSDITMDYTTVDGSAVAGSDYQGSSGTLTIPAGQTSKTITVKIFGDKTYESDETFTVVLSNLLPASSATFSKSIGNGLIKNDDPVIPGLKCFRTDFSNTTTFADEWTTSKSSGSFSPNIVAGRLQMTQAQVKQSTTAMLKKFFPPAKNRYITVEFDAYAYNGSGADGMAVVLSDASVTPVAGAFGGSLGYAQKCENGVAGCSSDCTVSGGCPGFAGGWLGIGFDEYSNFSNGSEGRYNAAGSGGSLARAVAIRGSDGNTTNKSSIYNYKYLYGTTTGMYASGAKYRVIIDAFDTNNTIVSVDVNKNDGNGFISLINGFDINTRNDANWVQKTIPDYFRLSVTGSTGSLTNIHELDNLEVCSVMYEESASDIYISEFSATPTSVSSTSDVVSFMLKIFNPGPVDTSENIVVSIPELSQWNIVSSNASIGSFSAGVWTIGAPLVKGGLATLSFSAKMTSLSTKTLNATASYVNDPDLTNNLKTITVTVPTNYQAVEKGGSVASKLFTKVAGQSFDADILTGKPSDVATLKLYGDGALLLDLNATPPTAVVSMSDRLRLTGVTVSKAAKVAQFEVNGTQISDSFAIKPSNFTLTSSASTIKAGEPFSLSAVNSTTGYNGTAAITTATYNQSCATKSGFLTTEPVSLSFATATQTAAGLVAKNIGDINVSIKDSTWTAVDQYTDCVQGSNSNVADVNGKVGCDVETNATIKIVPYDMNASKSVADPMWAYKSINAVPKFSFSFDVNATRPPIATLGETQPQPVNNFSSTCFSKDSSIDIVMGLNPNSKSLTNSQDVNVTTTATGVVVTPSSAKLTIAVPAALFAAGTANITLNINSEKNITTPDVPLVLTATKWTTSADGTTYGSLDTSNPVYFLYGKIAAPDAIVDYNSASVTVRAYAQVYATNSSSLPSGTWTQAPGSSNWWINSLDNSSLISSIYIRKSDTLTALSNEVGNVNSTAASVAGVAPITIAATGSVANITNSDQKLKLHMDVPAYLWYGANAYSYSSGSNCSQHPCMSVDVFGTQADSTWYGTGTKEDKTIKSVPKGKRAPKVNW